MDRIKVWESFSGIVGKLGASANQTGEVVSFEYFGILLTVHPGDADVAKHWKVVESGFKEAFDALDLTDLPAVLRFFQRHVDMQKVPLVEYVLEQFREHNLGRTPLPSGVMRRAEQVIAACCSDLREFSQIHDVRDAHITNILADLG